MEGDRLVWRQREACVEVETGEKKNRAKTREHTPREVFRGATEKQIQNPETSLLEAPAENAHMPTYIHIFIYTHSGVDWFFRSCTCARISLNPGR